MKVILVNGSPHEHGCTRRALDEVASALAAEGIATDVFWIGTTVRGCLGCYACQSSGACVFQDCVADFLAQAEDADGLVFGSPVYFASAAGGMASFMDRVFFSGRRFLAFKPAAAVVSCRRGGSTVSFDRLNRYFTISNMPVVPSQYWNQVHGNTPAEVEKDAEGLQTMRILGRNMAWLLKAIQCGKDHGIEHPETEQRIATNFIREDL